MPRRHAVPPPVPPTSNNPRLQLDLSIRLPPHLGLGPSPKLTGGFSGVVGLDRSAGSRSVPNSRGRDPHPLQDGAPALDHRRDFLLTQLHTPARTKNRPHKAHIIAKIPTPSPASPLPGDQSGHRIHALFTGEPNKPKPPILPQEPRMKMPTAALLAITPLPILSACVSTPSLSIQQEVAAPAESTQSATPTEVRPPDSKPGERVYRILVSQGAFEIRDYEPAIAATTTAPTDFRRMGNVGFQRLAGYIFGGNSNRDEIAMTAPVDRVEVEDGSAWEMVFYMPVEWSMETLPTPNSDTVTLERVPQETLATITYSGLQRESDIERFQAGLTDWLTKQGYEPIGKPRLAGFDAPYVPANKRRNEVQIPVKPINQDDADPSEAQDRSGEEPPTL